MDWQRHSEKIKELDAKERQDGIARSEYLELVILNSAKMADLLERAEAIIRRCEFDFDKKWGWLADFAKFQEQK